MKAYKTQQNRISTFSKKIAIFRPAGPLKSACQVKISDCVANFADAFSSRDWDTVEAIILSN